VLVRTWNLFHGNTLPPGRRGYLREMVELVTADGPDVVALQEVPVWAVRRLEHWSGMRAFAVVATYPRLHSAQLGRWITHVNVGLIRSALAGQANAILVTPGRTAGGHETRVVSTTGERRVAHGLTVDGIFVVNFHVTGGPPAQAQFEAVLRFAEPHAKAILAGDANLRPPYDLPGWSEPLAGSIDQVLVRGLPAGTPVAWPAERRRIGNRLLSDHAPVELRVG
jgi:endonuclease/exonuclease/phosphatase family metal-dependent hydrolase